jgi:hypothetical protein
MGRLISVVSFLALSNACAAVRPPAAAGPPRQTAEITPAQPKEEQAAAVEARASTPIVPPPSLDPIREQRRAEEQREQEEDAALLEAQRLFQQFIDKAGNDPAYVEAVQRSRERIADIDQILRFRAQGRLERARAEGTE